jgi:hypothetical protein
MSESTHAPLVVVSGFPRSGTSMMMQMLEAGGLPALMDELRSTDESNPKGYYEYMPVKALSADTHCLNEAEGKCVKIIAPLLRHLPLEGHYKIILMQRDLDEVVRSHQLMMDRLHPTLTSVDHETLRSAFPSLIKIIDDWLSDKAGFEVLPVEYADAIADPLQVAEQVNAFLDGKLDVKEMASAVECALYRARKDA